VFLVHGFKSPEAGAQVNYAGFRQCLQSKVDSTLDELVYVIWPGDQRAASVPDYGASIEVAEAVAPYFVDFLTGDFEEIAPTAEVVFVAHSLGCLLLLETLVLLARHPEHNKRPITVMLMAAAVPVSTVGRSGRLRSALAGEKRTSYVLYSPRDWVLNWPFRPGHWLKHPNDGFMPEAVGLRGQPASDTWRDQWHMEGHGHNDYWSSGYVAERVAQVLAEKPSGRDLPERALHERELARSSQLAATQTCRLDRTLPRRASPRR